MQVWIVALMVAAAGLVAPIAALATAQPRQGEPLLVILPPWRDADQVLARAGARPVAPVRAPFAVLAVTDTDIGLQDLRSAGAWAVLHAGALSFLCSETS